MRTGLEAGMDRHGTQAAAEARAWPHVFGRWQLLPERRVLMHDDTPVALSGRAFDLLQALVEADGAPVAKHALLRRLWPATHVAENSLHVVMSGLRKALGRDARMLIETVPGQGYRFAGDPGPISPPPPASTVRARLAVLPFANMTGDPAHEHLTDGLTEDLTTALSHLRWFDVIARNSAFTYKGRPVDVREVGRELHVGYVLEGSVRQIAGRYRIAAQLCSTASGRNVWAARFDGVSANLLEQLDAVTDQVVGALEPSLRQAEIERARERPMGNLGAYELFLRALPHCHLHTRAGTAEAVSLLRRACAMDPDFASGRAMLAGVLSRRIAQRWGEPGDADHAIAAARDVVARIGSEDPSALACAANVLAFVGRDFAAAASAGDHALALAPNSATVLSYAAWTALYAGQWDDAIGRVRRAIRLSPLDPLLSHSHRVIALAHFGKQDYTAAVCWVRRSIAGLPTYLTSHLILASCLAHLGEHEQAREAVATIRALAPGETVGVVAALSASSGPTRERYLAGLRRAGLPE